jgi:hypothetical protein
VPAAYCVLFTHPRGGGGGGTAASEPAAAIIMAAAVARASGNQPGPHNRTARQRSSQLAWPLTRLAFCGIYASMLAGTGKAFWLWDEDHPVREAVYAAVTSRYFEYAMLVVIILNCVQMACENPFIEPGSVYDQVSRARPGRGSTWAACMEQLYPPCWLCMLRWYMLTHGPWGQGLQR